MIARAFALAGVALMLAAPLQGKKLCYRGSASSRDQIEVCFDSWSSNKEEDAVERDWIKGHADRNLGRYHHGYITESILSSSVSLNMTWRAHHGAYGKGLYLCGLGIWSALQGFSAPNVNNPYGVLNTPINRALQEGLGTSLLPDVVVRQAYRHIHVVIWKGPKGNLSGWVAPAVSFSFDSADRLEIHSATVASKLLDVRRVRRSARH